MRPAWRLAISTASRRRNRTALMVATVALSAALIAAVACAMASLDRAIEANVVATVGRADLKLAAESPNRPLPATLLNAVRSWPEVAAAAGQFQTSLTLEYSRPWWGPGADQPPPPGDVARDADPLNANLSRRNRSFSATGIALGIVPEEEHAVRPRELVSGRWPQQPGEIALDEMLAGRLSRDAAPGSIFSQVSRVGRGKGMRDDLPPRPDSPPMFADTADHASRLNRAWELAVGDQVRWIRLFRRPVTLTVVGIVAQPPLGARSQAYFPRDDLLSIAGEKDALSTIDAVLKPGESAELVATARRKDLPRGATIQTSEKITSSLQQNLAGNRVMYIVVSTMAFLGASFIIMTGLLTAVTERQRELAILRCVGATRAQVAEAQLVTGALIGLLGALLGVPLGVAIAASVVGHFEAEIPTGLSISPVMLGWAAIGAVLAGTLGAFIPAWMASNTSPLAALAARARVTRPAHVRALAVAAVVLIPLHLAAVFVPSKVEVAFWLYVLAGIPALITGYFLLGVPLVILAARLVGPLIAAVTRVPRVALVETIRASPMRYGFTAGAMSFGLAIMVGIWAQGNAVLRDWIDRLRFPEAFVVGLNLSPEAQNKLMSLPFVRQTCAITLQPVQSETFGIKGLATYTSTFIAFEPDSFFDMTNLQWVEGDLESARRRLNQGGAVLVAKEFTAAKGLGLGDTFTCKTGEREASFEIVGVVHSPGLEIISQYFTIGQDYTEQAVHAVFGSRRDLIEKFGSDAIQMIQIGLVPENQPGAVDDETAVKTIRRELLGSGIYDAGSARKILADIRAFVQRTLLVSTSIGGFALVVASLGVANIIAAGIAARRFEFGVLRAVGATRGLLGRLVLGEVLIVAITACVIGTVSGLQGALAGQRIQKLVLGMELSLKPPLGAIAVGCGMVLVVCLIAAALPVAGLVRRRPRELLASMRG
ncbi:MAG: hypothetical protein GIKADHBN_03521 [Phycisphaerales bacterium]|nr:hypothetical protein [Phycisphaerales bacterium]